MLDKRQKYLQIAFNRTLGEIAAMINSLPISNRIIIEAGYPLIKNYGTAAIRAIKTFWEQKVFGYISGTSQTSKRQSFGLMKINSPLIELLLKSIKETKIKEQKRKLLKNEEISFEPYIVADLKCMDRAFTEVETAASAGASAATCLGLAPPETIDAFVKKCEEIGIDSILDMINVQHPFEVLGRLRKLPQIIMLHRGVDEREKNKEKEIPYHEIERIKSAYDNILIATAGGETINEVFKGIFNGADIIIVWQLINENPGRITDLTNKFLKEIK